MCLYVAHVLHKSGSLVMGCYNNKHLEVHFRDTRQCSLNILSLRVLQLVGFERMKLRVLGCPVIWYKMLDATTNYFFCVLFV